MKYFIFHRPFDKPNFDDILKDPTLKGIIREKIKWPKHLLLGIEDYKKEEILSYVTLKYGDDLVSMDSIVKDRAPVMFKEYQPIGLPNKEILKKKMRVLDK